MYFSNASLIYYPLYNPFYYPLIYFPNTVNGCGIASLKTFYGKEFATNTFTWIIVSPWKKFRTCKIRTILIHIEPTKPALYFLLRRQNGDIAETYRRVLTNRWDFKWRQLQVFRVVWPVKITESQNLLMSRTYDKLPGLKTSFQNQKTPPFSMKFLNSCDLIFKQLSFSRNIGLKGFKSKFKQTLVNLSTLIERLCETACTPIKVIVFKLIKSIRL